MSVTLLCAQSAAPDTLSTTQWIFLGVLLVIGIVSVVLLLKMKTLK